MTKTILFQGDSVTDVGRFEENTKFLGNGYVKLIAEEFEKQNQTDIRVINRGISGNRVRDLKERWKEDCIDLQPDLLTILIGINNCWRKYDKNDETPIELFEADYDYIIKQTKENTKSEIILMEPFLLPIPADRLEWRITLDPEIQVVRHLAKKYNTKLITLDGIFAIQSLDHDYEELAADGVHPTMTGHKIICDSWFKLYNNL